MVAITATGGGSQGQEAVCNDIVFLMEATSACGAFLNEIKANYVAPIVEYFNGGAVVEDKVGLAVRGDRHQCWNDTLRRTAARRVSPRCTRWWCTGPAT